MAAIIAVNNFSQAEIKDMEELVEINEQMKVLENKKKILSDKVKSSMVSKKLDKVDINGSVLSIIESTRKTVTKATKDEFIAALVGMNKKHLITYSIEPDLDSIFAEVDAGSLQGDFVNKYVKVSPVITLRCNV